MALDKLYYVYGLDTSCFYTEEENKIEQKIIKAKHLKYVMNEWIEKENIVKHLHRSKFKFSKTKSKIQYINNHEKRLSFLNKYINTKKSELTTLLKQNKNLIRNVNTSKLTLNRRVSIFDSNLTRCLNLKEREINTEILIIKIYYFDIAESIIKNGFYMNGYEYVFFTSSSGQIRTKKLVAVRKDLLNNCWNTLTCGLTVDHINKCGGMNINKYITYTALCNSATDLWRNFDIDRCIVVDDFETTVNDTVDFIDDKTYKIERKKMNIPIPHTDGVGMILPCLSPKNFMVRLPFIKGLLGSFDFVKFIKANNTTTKIKDIYGDEYDIIKDNIQIIFTKSQFKMHKYYSNWKEYKDNFKKYNCTAGKCKEDDDVFKDSSISYQMMQTLTDISDDELNILCKENVNDIKNVTSDLKTMLKILKADENNYNKTPLQKCISIYPELISDLYIRKILKELKVSLEKDLWSAKLKVGGKYTFVIPDLYAFCEFLFLNIQKPKGILKDHEVCCKLFEDKIKLDCLRSPSLYKEHAVRINNTDNEWLNTNAIYTSTFDTISKILQFDCDGDTLLVINNETMINIAERNMKNIVPLYYNMAKANSVIINQDEIFKGLMLTYTGGNIGIPSNDISKIWNSEEITSEKMDVVKWLCLQTNFTIDYAKTLYKPDPPKEVSQKINKYIKEKVPYFFKFAKGKEDCQVNEINNSTINRIYKLYKPKNLNFNFKQSNIGKFDYHTLLHDFNAECIENVALKFKELSSALNFNKLGEDSLNNYFSVFDECKKELLSLGYDINEIVDSLVIDLFHNRKTKNKKAFWFMFGDIVYKNIKNNIDNNSRLCSKCGKRFIKTKINQVNCSKCSKYTPVKQKTIICQDCGTKFIVSSSSRKTRCDKCKNEERKLHNKLMYQQRKNQFNQVNF